MNRDFCTRRIPAVSRRDALRTLSAGFGYLAFAGLAAAEQSATRSSLAVRQPHFEPLAKRVIFLCMRGGPSHVDTFDYKPRLVHDHGRPSSYGSPWCRSPWKFKQHGDAGLWISELFPRLAEHADSLCLLRSMHCDQPAHAQAMLQLHTGHAQFVRPSLGAWSLYGLGTENQNLPGFISINPPSSTGGAQNYGSAFLPAAYQGTKFTVQDSSQRNRRIDRMRRGEVNPNGIANAVNNRLSRGEQQRQLELIAALDREKLSRDIHNPIVEGAIENFELAFRMQDAVPQVMNLSDETAETLALYGIDEDPTDGFGRQCLLARRLAEAGVRFIELGHGSWDQHSNIQTALASNCAETDKPIAGLLADLKRRDLLKDTLVVWGGEFGRTPYSDSGTGRDHNHKGFTMWMAGGGVKGGVSYGATDEHGYEAVTDHMHIHDWHATILHLLGLDHERLTFLHAGREMRLTDVAGTVAKAIIQ
ncbi:DUF1501 domain-containing protein [Thalassoroseus pseudoceratinae]|uniref:DUF1501 domain-containing protein n=1 Tax=Thalassoroseus pseudoceratinae TaxID=2713176 RepID=UPI001420D9A2|nr:DUF1501 domain-containing protein [Thalassoroseus pseudoceratinae]